MFIIEGSVRFQVEVSENERSFFSIWISTPPWILSIVCVSWVKNPCSVKSQPRKDLESAGGRGLSRGQIESSGLEGQRWDKMYVFETIICNFYFFVFIHYFYLIVKLQVA